MAVIVKYVVVRNGVEKMTFATKKEADEYDKMLDISERLFEFIEAADLGIQEKQTEDLSFYLAQHKEKVISILKGLKTKTAGSPKSAPSTSQTGADKKSSSPKKDN